MKDLYIVFVVLCTFGIALLTSCLYDLQFFASNWVRFSMLTLFILLELVSGLLIAFALVKKIAGKK